MKSIHVDSEVFEIINRIATSKMQTPNTVLRRVFGLKEEDEEQVELARKRLEKIELSEKTVFKRKAIQVDETRNLTLQEEDSITYDSGRVTDNQNLGEPGNYEVKMQSVRQPTESIDQFLPELPHHIPTALEHTLQMIHLVRRFGLTRIEATKKLAEWHRIEIPTVTIKFTRLLGITSYEVDRLLEPENIVEFRDILQKAYKEYSEIVGAIVL